MPEQIIGDMAEEALFLADIPVDPRTPWKKIVLRIIIFIIILAVIGVIVGKCS